jgi:hypothetical protein
MLDRKQQHLSSNLDRQQAIAGHAEKMLKIF